MVTLTAAGAGARSTGWSVRARGFRGAAALAVLTILVFSRLPFNDFVVFDDQVYVLDNAVVRAGLTWEGARLAFARSYGGNWHPLTWLSHMTDVELFGLDPRGHHATSLLVHALTVSLLHLVLVSLTGAAGPSAFAAALFAVHPLHVESVAWIAERKDVLCGLFWVLTMAAYVRYVRRPWWGRRAAVAGAFALCLTAKPMGVTLPVILLALDFWPLGRFRGPGGAALPPHVQRLARAWGRLVLEKIPLLLLAALSAAVTWTAQSKVGAVISLAEIPFGSRLANAILSYWAYLGKAVFPVRLAVYYPILGPVLADARVLLGACALVATTAAAAWSWRRAPYFPVGWFWFLIGLAPVIGLIQVGEQAMADRYTYLPLVGPFVAIAWGAAQLGRPRLRSLLPWAACATIFVLSGVSWRQTAYWRDTESLFEHALRVTEGNWFAHNNYAGALIVRGQLEQAVAHLSESLRIRPGYLKARLNLERAIEELEAARRVPDGRQPPVEVEPK